MTTNQEIRRRSSTISCSESNISYYDEDIGLLTLPNLILDEIFHHLSPTDILSLRLTCQSTKFWVETKFLDKLCLNIKSRSIFTSLLKSGTGWTNFSFHWKLNPSSKQLTNFTLLFSQHISTLQFTSNVYDSAIIKIISSCPYLKILTIEEIDGSTLSELSSNESLLFSKACSSLEHLGIFEIISEDHKGANFFINNILSVCTTSLKSVVVPYLTFSPSWINAYPFKYADTMTNTNTTPTDILVVRPLIEILENISKTPKLESIVVIPDSRTNLSDSGLFCLTMFCYQRRLNLVYDHFNEGNNFNLGKLVYSLNSSETGMQMSEIGSKIMTTMSSVTECMLNYEFANLRKLIVKLNTFQVYKDIFVVQDYPRLSTFYIHFMSGSASILSKMNMFFQGILEVPRPSVQNVQITNHFQVRSTIPFSMDKFVNCFINLRSLCIIGFKRDGKDFPVIWKNLRLLQKIEMEHCPGLNDYGILGQDWTKPAFLELTDLRELILIRTGRITDLSYIIVFCRMRLTRFYHKPLYQADVTFEGYNALARGDFSKTIKFLGGTITHFGRMKKDALIQYLNLFPSLLETQKKKRLRRIMCEKWKNGKLKCF